MTDDSAPRDQPETVTAPWASAILDFWFKELGPDRWWASGSDAQLDQDCRDRFAPAWREKRMLAPERFLDRADEALAAILLFDQLPRNMFRGKADAFATDPLARDIARGAIARGYDVQIGGAGRLFFYMPFQHSEAIEDQDLAITLIEALGDEQALRFAHAHRAMIARFGRFPHRNAALGRAMAPGEADAVAEGSGW